MITVAVLGPTPGTFAQVPWSVVGALLAGVLMMSSLVLAQPGQDVGGATVRTYPVGVGARAFQQESDLPQSFHGIHSGRLLRGRGLSVTVGIGGASITFSERLTMGGNRGSRLSQADRKSTIS